MIVVVAVEVLFLLTLLPVVLVKLGDRLEKLEAAGGARQGTAERGVAGLEPVGAPGHGAARSPAAARDRPAAGRRDPGAEHQDRHRPQRPRDGGRGVGEADRGAVRALPERRRLAGRGPGQGGAGARSRRPRRPPPRRWRARAWWTSARPRSPTTRCCWWALRRPRSTRGRPSTRSSTCARRSMTPCRPAREALVTGVTAETVDYSEETEEVQPWVIAAGAGALVPAAADGVQEPGPGDQGDRHEPAQHRGGAGADRAALPGGPRRGHPRLREPRLPADLDAADPVHHAVRPLDGLRGVHGQPDQGGVRPDRRHAPRPSRSGCREPARSSPTRR